jgi:hypothetical protein
MKEVFSKVTIKNDDSQTTIQSLIEDNSLQIQGFEGLKLIQEEQNFTPYQQIPPK